MRRTAVVEFLGLVLVWASGVFVGGMAVTWWIEHRHDCLPHDPQRCREVD